MAGSSSATFRGVNPRLISRRNVECSGRSIMTSVGFNPSFTISFSSKVRPSADE